MRLVFYVSHQNSVTELMRFVFVFPAVTRCTPAMKCLCSERVEAVIYTAESLLVLPSNLRPAQHTSTSTGIEYKGVDALFVFPGSNQNVRVNIYTI